MILVFGAAGFIGTYLIDELKKNNYEVVASDISDIGEGYYKEQGIPFIKIDITKKTEFDKLSGLKIDAIINLACVQPANVSIKNFNPVDYITVNTIGTLNVLDFCRKANVGKIIYVCSHRNTQGMWYKGTPIKEEDGRSIKYTGEYTMFSISESAAQDCVEYYSNEFGIKSLIFRLPPVYGYGPHTEIFLGGKPIKTGFQIFIDNAMACKPLEIWGESNKGRDIVYVKDVVSAFIKALKSDTAAGLYNITSGRMLTLKEQAEVIADVFWCDDSEPVIIERPEIPNTIESYVYDISKAANEFGWSPQYDFKSMLIDYQKEKEINRFGYLLEKRRMLLNEG